MVDTSEEWWTAFLLCDSSFPGGTLAHSQGLESAMMHDYVDGENINNFIKYAVLALEQASYLLKVAVDMCDMVIFQSVGKVSLVSLSAHGVVHCQ